MTNAAPKPVARLPWSQGPKCVVIYDADGKPVSLVQNADYVLHVVQQHVKLVTVLKTWRGDLASSLRMWGFPTAAIEDLCAQADAALAAAGVVMAEGGAA